MRISLQVREIEVRHIHARLELQPVADGRGFTVNILSLVYLLLLLHGVGGGEEREEGKGKREGEGRGRKGDLGHIHVWKSENKTTLDVHSCLLPSLI